MSVSSLAVVDCHWHPGRLPPCCKTGFNGFLTLGTRPVEMPVILTGCAVYGLADGGTEQVNLWMGTDRSVYFGVSGIVQRYTDQQKEGICIISSNRILIETYSPYLPNGGKFPNTPKHIGETYRCLSEIGETSVEQTAGKAVQNLHALFGQQLRRKP